MNISTKFILIPWAVCPEMRTHSYSPPNGENTNFTLPFNYNTIIIAGTGTRYKVDNVTKCKTNGSKKIKVKLRSYDKKSHFKKDFIILR